MVGNENETTKNKEEDHSYDIISCQIVKSVVGADNFDDASNNCIERKKIFTT